MEKIQALQTIKELILDLNTCRIKEGIEKLDKIITFIFNDINTYNTECVNLINEALLMIEKSFKNLDYILLADIFEYELLPFLIQINEMQENSVH